MAVVDGARVNASTTNAAFVSRTQDTSTIGVFTLNNTTDANSGAQITNAQRAINETFDAVGMTGEGDATRKNYSSNNHVVDGDSHKVAIGKLDTALNAHEVDATDVHTASAITNTPSGNLVATDVQGALNEIQTELDTATSLSHTQNTDTGTNSNTFTIGDNADTDKKIEADTGAANNPALRYNTTDDAWEFSNDGVAYSAMGSGAGGGGLDTLHTQDFESLAVASFNSTGLSATYKSGVGSFNGTLTDETTNPIAGTQSPKYTAGASSTNDWFDVEQITLDDNKKVKI